MAKNDPHLNLFFSYHGDNVLIENNMTRAFIVTLKMLSLKTKKDFLKQLLKDRIDYKVLDACASLDFALQDNIKLEDLELRNIPHKYLVALTGNNILEDGEKYQDPIHFERMKYTRRIRPDAWIYESTETPSICFLFECKTVNDTLHASQIISYAMRFFGLTNYEDVRKQLIQITWYDVLDVCKGIIDDFKSRNEQEAVLLQNLADFLGLCGVSPFKGINFGDIPGLPSLGITGHVYLRLDHIPELPDYRFHFN